MKNIWFLIVTVFLYSCGQENKPSTGVTFEIDLEKELKEIENLRDSFSLTLKEGRYDDMGKWVSSDVKIIGPGGSDWNKMYDLGKERGRFPYDSIIMKPTETFIMNDSMAYDWGTSSVYYTDEEENIVELKNSFLVILKKENGEWKLHREVGSSTVE
jgi:hypothetical protein